VRTLLVRWAATFALASLRWDGLGELRAASLSLLAPRDYQVIQRESRTTGTVVIHGKLADFAHDSATVQARINQDGKPGLWRSFPTTFAREEFEVRMPAPAGGWYDLEVKVVSRGESLAHSSVAHVGIGEVFVVAGQSNSANHGEERQRTVTSRVSTFDGERWQPANDPMPGASGGGGSFMPPLGDLLVERFDVPVGFVACGIGATSVREWLPKGSRFANPPTLLGQVQKVAEDAWESKGQPFERLVARMQAMGPRGFRAVLWHQGESDANQQDPTRTLPGALYHDYLAKIIKQSRLKIGWEAPWFVAQVSYHVPGDEASPDIRAAQAALWQDGTALEGPDTDSLKSEWREAGGRGVHFSGPGLREHAARWMEKLAPWLDRPSETRAVKRGEGRK